MTIHLNQHSEALLQEQLAHGRFQTPEEVIERALELLDTAGEASLDGVQQREAVREMLEFVKRNRVHLEAGVTVRDLIHEGHRM